MMIIHVFFRCGSQGNVDALYFWLLRCQSVRHVSSDWNKSTIGLIAIKCGADIHDPQKIDPESRDFFQNHHEADIYAFKLNI